MTGIIINNNEYQVSTGNTKIEYSAMGGSSVSYSIYGDEIPLIEGGIKKASFSDLTSWYIDLDGDLYGCGINGFGQQGSGTSGSGTNVLTFTKRASDVKDILCTGDVTWYMNESNNVYGCGYNLYGQQGNGESGSNKNVTSFTKRA